MLFLSLYLLELKKLSKFSVAIRGSKISYAVSMSGDVKIYLCFMKLLVEIEEINKLFYKFSIFYCYYFLFEDEGTTAVLIYCYIDYF